MAQDRAAFRALARSRLAEARILAEQGHPSGAYYLAGYAVECALKAVIAGRFRADEIPDRVLVNRIYTHDLSELLRLSGLQADFKTAEEADANFAQRWTVITAWSESARYGIWNDQFASAMIDALDGDDNGIFRWLTNHW